MEISCEEQMELPPGFRFHPTDEELVTHYLSPKIHSKSFSAAAIAEVDLNKVEPWELPCKCVCVCFLIHCRTIWLIFMRSEFRLMCSLQGRQKWGKRSGTSFV